MCQLQSDGEGRSVTRELSGLPARGEGRNRTEDDLDRASIHALHPSGSRNGTITGAEARRSFSRLKNYSPAETGAKPGALERTLEVICDEPRTMPGGCLVPDGESETARNLCRELGFGRTDVHPTRRRTGGYLGNPNLPSAPHLGFAGESPGSGFADSRLGVVRCLASTLKCSGAKPRHADGRRNALRPLMSEPHGMRLRTTG